MSNIRKTILAAVASAVVALGAGAAAAGVVNQSFYYINGTSGKRVLLCSATTTSTGVFICTVPLPSGSLAGPAGTHGILILGKSRIRYTTQIFTPP